MVLAPDVCPVIATAVLGGISRGYSNPRKMFCLKSGQGQIEFVVIVLQYILHQVPGKSLYTSVNN
jgi:hypothetical protein